MRFDGHNRQCTATSKHTGQRCQGPAMKGSNVCRMHGGGAPQSRAAANQRLAEQKAARHAATIITRRDISPTDALLDLVQWTAGEVDYWRGQVSTITDTDLTWGTTTEVTKNSGEFPGTDTTQAAEPNVAYRMLADASDRLAKYAALALKAGVEERRVQLAEQQGALVAGVIRAVLARLGLTPEQEALVPVVVPEELRALSGVAS